MRYAQRLKSLCHYVALSCKGGEGKTPATADVAAAINNSGEFEELIALTEDNISRRYYGIDLEAIEEFERFRAEISERETYMEKLFDFNYAMEAVRSIIKGRQRDEAFAG